jgi:membrane peptidoglycan carboxypeptidase
MRRAGLKGSIEANPSLALGAAEINMFDYARSFNTLANGGIYNELHFITRVEDQNGNILFERKDRSRQVLDRESTFILNQMMTTTYNPRFVSYAAPTALHMAPNLSRRYAIKTGTTDADFWFVGYNPDIMMIVWAGNDMNANIPRSYSRGIRDIWLDTVEFVLSEKEENWYELPENVVALPLNAVSGDLDTGSNNSVLFYFKRGSEPRLFSN